MSNSSDDNASADSHRYGYDPKQPRVPAGHNGGGQWTRGGYGPQEQAVRLAFRGRQAPLPRVPSPPVAPTRLPPIGPKPGPGGGWGILGTLLGLAIQAGIQAWREGKTDQQPALVFKSWDYKKSPMDGSWRLHSIELLDEKEIQEICGEDKRIDGLQNSLDKTAKNMGFGPGKRVTGPDGTKAHQEMQKALGDDTEILIAPDENGKFQVVDKKNNPKDSVRLDWLLWKGKPTVCVEDHKFGEGGLDLKRTSNIVVKASDVFPDATRMLIFQGKPTKAPRPKPE